MRFLPNQMSQSVPAHSGLFEADEYEEARRFFRSHPDLKATPLIRLDVGGKLRFRNVLLKDESDRFGLDSFKIAGVLYAVHRLIANGSLTKISALTCATDGNHGRAVAHVARKFGLHAKVFVPRSMVPARVRALRAEGAEVLVVDGNYDETVRRAAATAAAEEAILISDTSWPGFEDIPRWIMAGYTVLLEEAVRQWAPDCPPELVVIQVGVGGLACAVVSWFCYNYGARRPFFVSCEPENAACLLESVRARRRVTIAGTLDTIMAGLSCGEVSSLAFPVLSSTVDLLITVDDEQVREAMCLLARENPRVTAGESGAAGLAALLTLASDPDLISLLRNHNIDFDSRVLIFNTEGATDPANYARVTKTAAGFLPPECGCDIPK